MIILIVSGVVLTLYLFFRGNYLSTQLNKQNNNSSLNIQTSTSTTTTIPRNQESAVASIIEAYASKNGYKKPIITTDFIYDSEARGNIRDESVAGGAKWFAVKIDGSWTVVHMGNGLPECKDVSKYKLSKDFLACY